MLMRTYDIDEGRKKDNDYGEDAHQGAVQSGLDYPLRQSLQRHWEQLRGWKDGQRRNKSLFFPTPIFSFVKRLGVQEINEE